MRSPAAFEFTPTNVPADLLDERTVGREDLLERIHQRIAAAARGGGMTHTLVIGARGSGKTHVLTVAANRAREEFSGSAAVVALAEDADAVVSYEDLLFTTIERTLLSSQGAVASEAGEILDAARRARRNPGELERLLKHVIGDRVLVLVLENLDRIFGDLGVQGQRKLRAFTEDWRKLLVVASTPLLFAGVSDRDQPWFGSFVAEHLRELSVDDGQRLLMHLAREQGNHDLADFLTSDLARGRLQAVAHIAGGSPRMWVMLSGCITVELLDELIPLVERLMENLVPYYQARLQELPGNERKLVVELARSSVVDDGGRVSYLPQGARNVTDLAEACGMERDVASVSLRRLADARWVRQQEMPGSDKRTKWYELREPLLRHHLQHRESGGGSLAVIVALLKAWYSPPQRVRLLGSTAPGARTEEHLLASLEWRAASHEAYASLDLDHLLGQARRWRAGDETFSATAAAVATAAVRGARGETGDVEAAADDRELAEVAARAARESSAATEARRVRDGLLAALAHAKDGEAPAFTELSLLAGGWAGQIDARSGVEITQAAMSPAPVGRLALALHATHAYFLWLSGEEDRAFRLGTEVLERRRAQLGDDDPDTLASRHDVAEWKGTTTDALAARKELQAVAASRGVILGEDHPDTLAARHEAAWCALEAGDARSARDELAAVAAARAGSLGVNDIDTMLSRCAAAMAAAELGDLEVAAAESQAVVIGLTAKLGPRHRWVLNERARAAALQGLGGRHELARDQLIEISSLAAAALGAEARETLRYRRWAARQAAALGDHATARAELHDVSETYSRVLGPTHAETLAVKLDELIAQGLAGDRLGAVAALAKIAREAESAEDVDSALARVLAKVDSPDEAAAAMRELEDLMVGLAAVLMAMLTLDSERPSRMRMWAAHVGEDVTETLLTAAASLADGDASAAAALPVELRRFAHLLAGQPDPGAEDEGGGT